MLGLVCVCFLHSSPQPPPPRHPQDSAHPEALCGNCGTQRGAGGDCEGGRRRCYTSWEPPASFFASLYQWRPLLSSPASPPPDGRERVGEEA